MAGADETLDLNIQHPKSALGAQICTGKMLQLACIKPVKCLQKLAASSRVRLPDRLFAGAPHHALDAEIASHARITRAFVEFGAFPVKSREDASSQISPGFLRS